MVAMHTTRTAQGEGFVQNDNSGRSNNFPTMSKVRTPHKRYL